MVPGDDLASFLQSGNSMLVATRNAALDPHVTRASGLRVVGPDRLEVLLPRSTSVRAIANLRDNGEIAVCVCSPLDFTAYQLKGKSVEVGDATREDVVLAEQQMLGFGAGITRFGSTRAQVRNLWLFDCWRVTVQVDQTYVQTPGPGAGRTRADDDGV